MECATGIVGCGTSLRVTSKSSFSKICERQWQERQPERQAEELGCDPVGNREPWMVSEQVHSKMKVLIMNTNWTVRVKRFGRHGQIELVFRPE